jgi:hypothetical protein
MIGARYGRHAGSTPVCRADPPPIMVSAVPFVQAAKGGYLVVLQPPRWESPAGQLEVRFVDPSGSQTTLSRLPEGTWAASFAATLVTEPATTG